MDRSLHVSGDMIITERSGEITPTMANQILACAERVHACRLVVFCTLLEDPSGRAALVMRRTDDARVDLTDALLSTLSGREEEIYESLDKPSIAITAAIGAFEAAVDELASLGWEYADPVVAKYPPQDRNALARALGHGLVLAATHFERRPARQFPAFVRWWVSMAIAAERARH